MSEAGALGLQAYRELEEHRRARQLQDWNIIDAMYKAYMTALVGGVLVAWLSGVVADDSSAALRRTVAQRGPAALGLVLAAAAWTGIRSGARGGPLTVTPATVRTVLLAPVDRGAVLRGPAVRQLRFGAFVGLVAGAVAGAFAFRRLTGPAMGWLASLAIFGAVTGLAAPATALVVAGRRVPTTVVRLAVAALAAGSAVDLARGGGWSSPTTYAGAVGLGPVASTGALADSRLLVGTATLAVLGIVVPALGVLGAGGVSLELTERRSRLVAMLRFAVTVRDLRAVILFRRLLGQEAPRSKPWLRLPRGARFAVWRRDWQGVLRWPAVRFMRLGALGVVAGLATVAAMSGTAELVIVAVAALYVAAAEAAEGVAQEADHPTLMAGLPIEEELLWARHLAVPSVVMAGVGLAAVAGAVVAAGPRALAGLLLVAPAAVLSAAMSSRMTKKPPDPTIAMSDPTGGMAVIQLLGPPLIAGSAVALLVLLREVSPEMPLLAAVRAVATMQVIGAVGIIGLFVAARPAAHGLGALSPIGKGADR